MGTLLMAGETLPLHCRVLSSQLETLSLLWESAQQITVLPPVVSEAVPQVEHCKEQLGLWLETPHCGHP